MMPVKAMIATTATEPKIATAVKSRTVSRAAGRLGDRGMLGGLRRIAMAAAACGRGSDGATVQGAKLVAKGALTTCTHLPYPPFQSEQGGKVVGFDVDLIDLVAKKLGFKQKIVDTPFETIKTGSARNAGKCDVAAAGMTIKPA